MSQPSLNDLVQRAQTDDLQAIGELIGRFQDMAVGYAWSILGDFQLAEDAAQEAFVQALGSLRDLREPAAFPAWLKRIVFKHCDRQTRGSRLTTSSLDGLEEIMSDDKQLTPEAVLVRAESAAAVRRAVAALPEHQREAVSLYYIGEHSQSEVAAFLDISEGAVRKRLHDARKVLKEAMITMVRDTLHDDAPSRDDRFEKRVLRSAMPLQVFAIAGEDEPRDDPHSVQRVNLGSTLAGRQIDIPDQAVWYVEPRLDIGTDDAAFDQLLSEMKQRRIPGLCTGGQLTDRHLPRLAELADQLLYLDIGGGNTGITADGLQHLGKLPHLRYLGVNLNGPCNSPTLVPADVSDAGLEFLSELRELEALDMHNLFSVSDGPMRHVQHMPNLRHIGLHGTAVTDRGLRHLAGLEHLTSVLPGPLTTGDGLAVLRDVPPFVDGEHARAYLGMGKSPFVGDAGLRIVGDLVGLDDLWLCESRLMRDRWVGFLDAELPWVPQYTGAGLEPLAQLPRLRQFGMSGDRQDDDALESIGRFPALQELGCAIPIAGDRGWQGLARSRSLTRIGAFEAPNLTGVGIAALATMPQLANLGVGGPNLLDDDLAPLADMTSLRRFSAERGNVFSDGAYAHIARIPGLQTLTTGIARTISDAATEQIATMPHLVDLHLSGWKMTDRTCELLADAPALESLSLRFRRLTDAGLPHLNNCKNLKTLKMDDCPLVTATGVAALRQTIDVDWNPATVRNLIEAVISDETVRDRAITALEGFGGEARHELEVFRDLVTPELQPIFQRLIDRLE